MIKLPKKKLEPSDLLAEYLIMIYGPPGVGKTTWALEVAPDALFLSTDRGTRYMTRYSVEVGSWEDVLGVIKALEREDEEKHTCFVLDHIDDIFSMCERYIAKKLGIDDISDEDWGKGWRMARQEFQTAILRLLRLGKGLVFIAHERIKPVVTRSIKIDKTMPDMARTAWKTIIPICNIVAYAGFKLTKKGKEHVELRTLTTEPKESLYVKDRTGRCPSTMELSGRKFRAIFEQKGTTQHVEKKKRKRSKKKGKRATR